MTFVSMEKLAGDIRELAGRLPQDIDLIVGIPRDGLLIATILALRLDVALAYAGENPQTVLVLSGGQGQGERITEAEAMRRYLTARGIGEERLRLEEASDSTYANFRNAKAMIEAEFGGEAKVLFVTTRFHVLRAEKVARSLGLEAEGIGARGVSYIAPNDYMREALVIVYYYLGGKI